MREGPIRHPRMARDQRAIERFPAIGEREQSIGHPRMTREDKLVRWFPADRQRKDVIGHPRMSRKGKLIPGLQPRNQRHRPFGHPRMTRKGKIVRRFPTTDQRDRPVGHMVICVLRIPHPCHKERMVNQNTRHFTRAIRHIDLFAHIAEPNGGHAVHRFARDSRHAQGPVPSFHQDHSAAVFHSHLIGLGGGLFHLKRGQRFDQTVPLRKDADDVLG